MSRQRPFSVSQGEYPFQDHWFERDGVAMHYLDEGSGAPVLMLHGNSTWSYLYRHVIEELAGTCRCIAPDYPGFGFSEHPPGYGYTPPEHAQWATALIDHLRLDGFILVVQDWGGPIGLLIAVDRPESVAGMVILNMWCWPPDWNLWIFSCVMGGPLGRLLHLNRNFFARQMVPWGIARKDRKTPEVLKAYTDPFPTPQSRMGDLRLPVSDPQVNRLAAAGRIQAAVPARQASRDDQVAQGCGLLLAKVGPRSALTLMMVVSFAPIARCSAGVNNS